MILLTRISLAKKGTKSLKTTVPEGVAEFLELSDKDELDWKMDVMSNERIAIIRKKQTIKPRLSSRQVRTEQRQNQNHPQEARKRAIDLISNYGKHKELDQIFDRIGSKR